MHNLDNGQVSGKEYGTKEAAWNYSRGPITLVGRRIRGWCLVTLVASRARILMIRYTKGLHNAEQDEYHANYLGLSTD